MPILNPRSILDQAASSLNGIELSFTTSERMDRLRTSLYRIKVSDEQRLLKTHWKAIEEQKLPTETPIPTTGWEDLIIRTVNPTCLWIGPSTMENLGITEIKDV